MKNFEYPEVVVRFYDIIYESMRNSTDHSYYLKKILESDGPVLEIGVGTGRFFCNALEKGVDIFGIDVSERMLQKIKSKTKKEDHFRIQHQDARTLSLGKKFNLIIAPFRVFSHILLIEDQLKVLNNIFNHLENNGKFIFDVFVPAPSRISKSTEPTVDFEGEYKPGKMIKRTTSVEPDYINQISLVTMKFEWEEEGNVKEDSFEFPFRYYFRYELENLIARSSLRLDKMYGDFNETKLTKGSNDFVIVCSKG